MADRTYRMLAQCGIVVNCVPQDCAAASAVFHFSGMFGTSEAFAESIGSTLNRFSKLLSIARCVENTIFLRSAGLTGHGTGGEDGFLELCWAFFGLSEAFFSLPQFEGATEAFCHGEVL